MNNGTGNLIKIVAFVLFLLGIFALVLFGFSKIKYDEFHKAAVMIILDSSASNTKELPMQIKAVRTLCSMLDPDDEVKILRVSESSYLIYEGSPQSASEIRKSLDKYTQLNSKEFGTALGLSMKKAFTHAINMHKEGYIPAVVVVGDLENEGAVKNQIDWNQLPSQVKEVVDKTGNFSMMFLYAAPDKLDLVKEKLTPVLGENKLIIGTDTVANKSMAKFLHAIGR